MKRFTFAIALLLAGTMPASARPMRLDDLGRLVTIGNPAFSPDGASIAYVESRIDVAHDKSHGTLKLLAVADGSSRDLTFGRDGLASPVFAPDGRSIAFEAKDAHGHEQVWSLPLSGGDPRPLTNAHAGVQQFAWRPDGGAIAYVTQDDDARKKAVDAHHDEFDLSDDDDLTTANDPPSHLWLVDRDGSHPHRLTRGTWSLATSYPPSPPSSPIAWSPDGSTILFTRVPNTRDGDAYRSRIERLDVATGNIVALTGHDRFEGFPVYSPDGSKIAYLYSRDGDPNNANDVMIVDAKTGGPGVDVSRTLDRALFRAQWLSNSTLLVGSHDGPATKLYRLALDGTSTPFELGAVQPTWSFWFDTAIDAAGDVAFPGTQSNDPRELYVIRAGAPVPRKVTDANAAVAALDLGHVRELTYTNDGFAEDGMLVEPPGFDPRKHYPLVLLVHGGPQASSSFAFDPFAQIIAAHGWLVFEPNYRGSDNFGNVYERAIYMDAGAGPGRDAMAGVAEVEKLGIVDTSRIAVSGWSYGGYMTSWLMSHYHIWKTAISGAAVNDWLDMYDLGDANVQIAFAFKGSPYVGDNMRDYVAQSPITYARRTRCPVLVISDTGDVRVPVAQSFAMYHALADNHIPVRFVGIPVGGHFPSDPVRAMDVYKLWTTWLADHFK